MVFVPTTIFPFYSLDSTFARSSTLGSSRNPAVARNLPDRPHFHGPEPYRWKLRGHLDRLVQISGADQEKSAEPLLRFRKGTVRHGQLPAADSETHGRLYGFELFYRKKLTAPLQRLAIGHGLFHHRVALALGHGIKCLFVVATHEQIFHGVVPPI